MTTPPRRRRSRWSRARDGTKWKMPPKPNSHGGDDKTECKPMLAANRDRWRGAPDKRPARPRPLGDTIQRLRLVQLVHSQDQLAAAIATAATLLLPRIDALIEKLEAAE